MSAPLSKDLRKRILAAKEEGASHAQIARQMRVSVSAITRLLALYRETGSDEPRPNPNGRKPALSAEQREGIRRKIDEQPDITLRELIEAFPLPVSAQALCNTIHKKLGLCRKKNDTRGGTTTSRRRGTTERVESKARRP
ncbi:MAG: helix-turn-helix domain-containing protein [Azoarcus sp.]|nr:helix-turn-helix domain-containing protein [Azoarcus sp.]